jgi:hypothetical protein
METTLPRAPAPRLTHSPESDVTNGSTRPALTMRSLFVILMGFLSGGPVRAKSGPPRERARKGRLRARSLQLVSPENLPGIDRPVDWLPLWFRK